MGETISHDRVHGLYHDLTVIQCKVSPTLQVSVYYLSRERRGNEEKKKVAMDGNLSLNWVKCGRRRGGAGDGDKGLLCLSHSLQLVQTFTHIKPYFFSSCS